VELSVEGSNPKIYEGTPTAKAALWVPTDAGVRKHGEQTGSDTLVVHAVSDECSSLVCQLGRIRIRGLANALNTPPGEYGRKTETQRN